MDLLENEYKKKLKSDWRQEKIQNLNMAEIEKELFEKVQF